jgi:hypothetical protein
VTIGQTGEPTDGCSPGYEYAQLTVTSGSSYFVPALPPATALTITSWSHVAYPDPGQRLKLKVYRPVPGTTSTFTVLAEDIRDPKLGVLNTFPTSIPVQAGDTIGITAVPAPGAPLFGCGFGPGGETYYSGGADQPVGSQVTFGGFPGGFRLNISAVVEPDADGDGFGDESQDRCPAGPGPIDGCPPNTFSFGKVKHNKQKGTATLTVDVSGPGTLLMTGKGLVKQRPGGTYRAARVAARTVSAAGKVKLRVKSKGKKKRKLNRTGKVKVRAKVTYTPTGGTPNTKTKPIKLIKTL